MTLKSQPEGPKGLRVFAKDTKDIRGELVPEALPLPLAIYCVAVHKDLTKNNEVRIPLQQATPIDGYIYNHISDRYVVKCYGSPLPLGTIPIAYVVRMNGAGNWKQCIPMPEAVLKRYMTTDQRRKLAQFKASLRQDCEEMNFQFIQMLSSYPNG